jgi:Fur family ferric uptake transcriptional regulator
MILGRGVLFCGLVLLRIICNNGVAMGNIQNDLRAALVNDGQRWTQARESVLGVLEKSPLPLSVKDILGQVHGKGINLASIYRATDLFAERNVIFAVESSDGVRRYELSDRYRPHHHHVVCRECGEIRDVSGCGVKGLEERAARSTGFKILSHQLSLIGLCPQCA